MLPAVAVLFGGTIGFSTTVGATPATVQSAAPYLYAGNPTSNSVTEYALGDTSPVATLSGADTGIDFPYAMALDSQGDLYIMNSQGPTITEFAPGATGDASPIATIDVPDPAYGVAVNAAGDVFTTEYVGTFTGTDTQIVEYEPSGGGFTAGPVIAGPADYILEGIALDAAGDVFVAGVSGSLDSFEPSAVFGYHSGASTPFVTIEGANSELNSPGWMAIDAAGDLFVSDDSSVLGYSAAELDSGGTIDPAPIVNLPAAETTSLQIALDATGDLFVGNWNGAGAAEVAEYAPGVTSTSSPSATIGGGALTSVEAVAVASRPGAPAVGTAFWGDASAIVHFSPPTSDGDSILPDGASPITGYTATARNVSDPSAPPVTAAGTMSPITVTGLTNGDRYDVTVKASNAIGTGAPSAPSNVFTPHALFVTKVSPASGRAAGGTPLTISGTLFAPGAVVKIGQGHGGGPGSVTCRDVRVISSGEITAVTPKGEPGTWNVFVIEPGSVASPPHPADRFTYTT